MIPHDEDVAFDFFYVHFLKMHCKERFKYVQDIEAYYYSSINLGTSKAPYKLLVPLFCSLVNLNLRC